MAKTMFGDVQLDANLSAILGPYSDTGNHSGQTTGLISSFYRLCTSREACITVSAALGLVLCSSTAILFGKVSVALNGLQETATLTDQIVAQSAPLLEDLSSAGVLIRSSSVGLELRNTRIVEPVTIQKPTRSIRKAKISRSFAQADFDIIRETEAPRTMRDVLPDPKPAPYETARADGAIASMGGKAIPLLDTPPLTQITGKGASNNTAVETDRSDFSRRVRRDTVDAIRALRRQW